MPRTRIEADRDSKVVAILDAAERQLRTGGGSAFSVAAIAREIGVAQNTVYWYFPSRDHLLVAVLERALSRLVASKRAQRLDLADEIVWFVERLHDLAPLRGPLLERAAESPVVGEFAARFQGLLRTMLTNALRPHVPAEELDLAVGVFSATVEGLRLQPRDRPSDRRTHRRLVAFALERLTDGKLAPSRARP